MSKNLNLDMFLKDGNKIAFNKSKFISVSNKKHSYKTMFLMNVNDENGCSISLFEEDVDNLIRTLERIKKEYVGVVEVEKEK